MSDELRNDDYYDRQASEPENTPPKKKKRGFFKKFFWFSFFSGFFLFLAGVIYYAVTIYPTLPDASSLKDVSYQVPLKILTSDGKLISEIGTKKRIPLDYTQIPERMTQALVSAEDEDFFKHGGISFKGLARAVYELITTGHKKSGGSTITMQVARNFFLTKKKSYLRKLNEIVLSYKIEHQISKEEILALYMNKMFLGYRSYGFAAAAQTYYGKDLKDLSLNEFAMLAGLPKAPSRYNPIYNPERAKLRRDYVLKRMYENHYITEEEMNQAMAVPVHAKLTGSRIDVEAGYVAEMARDFAIEHFGDDALKNGLTITTTIDSHLQDIANKSVRDGLQSYEKRHGYRGAITHFAPTIMTDHAQLISELSDLKTFASLDVGAVTETTDDDATVMLEDGTVTHISLDSIKWARPYIDVNKTGPEPEKITDVLNVGDAIYLQLTDSGWQLAQNPKTEAALISVDPDNGSIKALVGGYDFFRSKYNRATQARRQVGSNIKPFLYSSALEDGMTAASIINDAPVVFHDAALEDVWRPENYSGRFYGPTRLRVALMHSRNLVSIRLLQHVGIAYAIKYIERFGFPKDQLNLHRDLSLALGSVQFTPEEVVRGYSTFANGGYLIDPFIIDKVQNFDGDVIYQANPKKACTVQCTPDDPTTAPKIITPQNAYIMTTMMQDVINHGTAQAAKVLNRKDIAGKTGTTNDQKDAWFSGFNPHIATSVWVGFDQPSTLGRNEFAGRAALPIWIEYMREALKPYPNVPFAIPDGLVNVPIDKTTGNAVPADTPGAFFEVFREGHAPKVPNVSEKNIEEMTQKLFQ
ncbi:penicillin-binding protein 1A [Hydrogenovibrio sp. JE_KL2]|uniref:penicillin-binding protein 1A n=1 Tax=Hydrogenovibrio sp. JE_KL2 TaxID=2651188 RepID=UPI00128AF35B|nr:penicillin-binding protein 1A [Hydrogenovibrio sp. JE_KL2]MPQ76424.1 penicillin-binding protein 1A [Hydrogenovibrio sp. JE_KL2]